MILPMLAGKFDPELVKLPGFISPKIDGVRCRGMNGVAMSRSMKPLKNRFLQAAFADGRCDGLDGELIVGEATDKDVFRKTDSAMTSEGGQPDFKFIVFDRWDMPPTAPFSTRLACIERGTGLPDFAEKLFQEPVTTLLLIDLFENQFLENGYEGAMYRSHNGLYKAGRSTTKEGALLKLKRFSDAEAEIIGVEERMHNMNPAETNELGRTKRSSHQENKVGNGALGALVCRGLTAFPGVQFNVGTGFDEAERKAMWEGRAALIGKVLKYKFFAIGVKDAPRHPVFLGMRELGT